MLDHSGSIGPSQFASLRSFVAKVAQRVATSTYSVRIGVITFCSLVTGTIPLTQYEGVLLDDLDDVIAGLQYGGGGTDLSKAIDAMRGMFNDP